MKIKIAILFFFTFIIKANAQTSFKWQKLIGGTKNDEIEKIINNTDTSIIFIGSSFSSDGDLKLNKGNADIWIGEISKSGNLIWENSFGSDTVEFAADIVRTKDSALLLIGSTLNKALDNSDILIYKTNNAGKLIWQKKINGSGYDNATKALATSDSGCMVLGYSNSSDGDIKKNYGDYDVVIIKMDKNGKIEWMKNFGGSQKDFSYDIIANQNKYLVSAYSSSRDIDLDTSNHSSPWLFEIDKNGKIVNSQFYLNNKDHYITSIVTQDGYYATGFFNKNKSIAQLTTYRFDTLLNLTKVNYFGDSNYSYGNCIASNGQNFLVSGVQNQNKGGDNGKGVVIELNSFLDTISYSLIGGTKQNALNSICIAPYYSIAAGYSTSTDISNLNNHGASDAWLISLTDTSVKNCIQKEKISLPFSLYPNPACGILNTEIKNAMSSGNISITDLSGRELMAKKCLSVTNEAIDISTLPSGMYILKYSNREGSASKIFVKE